MKFGVVVFPGSNCEMDCYYVLDEVCRAPVTYLWHEETSINSDIGCVLLPGGFSYGDYLRCGAIARFSPIMKAVVRFAEAGGLVFGICNGFQILTEAGLLPGVLLRNRTLKFICKPVNLLVERHDSPFSQFPQEVLEIPINHGLGNYFIDPEGLRRLQDNGQVLFRYCDADGRVTPEANPNGSLDNIAGIVNEKGNVLGMMPHPERCSEPELGGTDGLLIWRSIISSLEG